MKRPEKISFIYSSPHHSVAFKKGETLRPGSVKQLINSTKMNEFFSCHVNLTKYFSSLYSLLLLFYVSQWTSGHIYILYRYFYPVRLPCIYERVAEHRRKSSLHHVQDDSEQSQLHPRFPFCCGIPHFLCRCKPERDVISLFTGQVDQRAVLLGAGQKFGWECGSNLKKFWF